MDNLLPLFFAGIIVVGLILIAVIVLVRRAPKGINREKYQHDWLTIEQSVTDDTGTQQLAIMNADKLLDRALKDNNYKGQTMGERMVSACRVFTRRDAAWAAHKLRNRLAHEDNVKLSRRLTQQALASFKQALKDLGAL